MNDYNYIAVFFSNLYIFEQIFDRKTCINHQNQVKGRYDRKGCRPVGDFFFVGAVVCLEHFIHSLYTCFNNVRKPNKKPGILNLPIDFIYLLRNNDGNLKCSRFM